MPEFHFYEPVNGHGLRHDPVKAIVAPRPIGWISTVDAQGRVNLAPYSFFNAFSERPTIIGFSSSGYKHSVANAAATGEFVYNLVTRDLIQQMNLSSTPLPAGKNEMDYAGLEPAPSRVVKPPRVAAAKAALECKVVQILQLQDITGRKLEQYLCLGQVVGVHIDKSCLKNGLFDMRLAGTVARCGYNDYADATHLFELPRPG